MTTRMDAAPAERDTEDRSEPKPRQQIRRFDVFAEYSKLKALREGRPLDEAKGYGIWLAKVVASRRYGAGSTGKAPESPAAREAKRAETPERFRTLSGELQTDALFDHEIIRRMGDAFYTRVFAPAIARQFENGDSYESTRDWIRRGWKPGP